MDEKLIKRVLADIAKEEIPDDMKTLWPAIQQQLEARPPRRTRHVTRLGWVTVMLIVSLVASAVTYAYYRRQTNPPGLDESLVTPIGESQSIDNTTVTLDWAYADANRLAVAYTVSIDDDRRVAASLATRLTDDQGHLFFGTSNMSQSSDIFEASENYRYGLPEYPEELHLHLEIFVASRELPEGVEKGSGGGSGGGGGGGGGGNGELDLNTMCGDLLDEPWIVMADEYPRDTWIPELGKEAYGGFEAVGVFTFEFTIPFTAKRVDVKPDQVVSANGVDMRLDRLIITPSMTRLALYIPARLNMRALIPLLDTSTTRNIQGIGSNEIQGESDSCLILSFPVFYDGSADTWTLSLQHDSLYPQDGSDRVPWQLDFEVPES